jgi:hypothetical protein
MNEFTYSNFLDPITGEVCSITRSDGASIPLDPANSDYQAYLESLNDNSEAE